MASRWAVPLTTEDPNPKLDLDDYVGQRASTFRFELYDAKTGYTRTITPISNPTPILTHNTSQTIKRQLTNMQLGVADSSFFNSITSRLRLWMTIGGVEYPLGQYIPSGELVGISTGGNQTFPSFYDEGFIIDQELTGSFGALIPGERFMDMLERFLAKYPVDYNIEPGDFGGTVAWSMGTRGGYVIDQIAVDGDWFSPWFDHSNTLRFIRAFDPSQAIPTFNFDAGNKVFRERIIQSNNLINAPNRFVVVSNGASSAGENAGPTVGMYDIPASAPHSKENRGFVVQKTENRQLDYASQATAVARNIGLQSTVFETTELCTAPDPRHDSYDVIRWRNANWLEIAWSLPLVEGSQMQHTLRKAYSE